jgi:hypothetical protein
MRSLDDSADRQHGAVAGRRGGMELVLARRQRSEEVKVRVDLDRSGGLSNPDPGDGILAGDELVDSVQPYDV